MELYTKWDCPFNCCCFWPCYCKHQVDIDTFLGQKRECFTDFETLEKEARTGDIYGVSTAGHWAFGPVWSSCQRRPSVWSHVGIIYVKSDNYKEELCEEFIEVLDKHPGETLFTFEAATAGAYMTPMRPIIENLYDRCFAGYLTIIPIKQNIRDRIPDLEKRFNEISNKLSGGTYQFNPCECATIVFDVWPCGCNCCCAESTNEDAPEEFDEVGVCTEYGVRVMHRLGYFEPHESDTKNTKYLKEEMAILPPEEITINDILGQTHLYDYDRQMIIVGQGCSCRAEAPSFMENWTFGEESQELGADPEDPSTTD